MAAMSAAPHLPASYQPAFCTPRSLLMGLGVTLGVNSVIAVVLWQSGRGLFDEQMVYSQAIGLSIWALTNAGARWLSRPDDQGGFPRGWRLWLLVPITTLAGALLGLGIGDLYATQSPAWALTTHNPALLGKIVAMSMGVGAVMTFYFYLRGKSMHLQAELERTQRQHAEAQLKLLESQLEPHMLFNTLANLRVLIGLDPQRAQAMLDHMIAYLRATLAASRQPGDAATHTLATEFDRLNDYLALMAIRMGPRLHVTLDLPPALRELPILPLLLQPLVENAIQHGLEPKVAGGHIVVRASLSDPLPGHLKSGSPPSEGLALPGLRAPAGPHHGAQTLCLEVTDDGVGTDATVPAAHPGSGFGMAQVRERLATAYGPNAAFELIALKPNGVSAKVHIQLKK